MNKFLYEKFFDFQITFLFHIQNILDYIQLIMFRDDIIEYILLIIYYIPDDFEHLNKS
jgi:hypothetical protein